MNREIILGVVIGTFYYHFFDLAVQYTFQSAHAWYKGFAIRRSCLASGASHEDIVEHTARVFTWVESKYSVGHMFACKPRCIVCKQLGYMDLPPYINQPSSSPP